MATLPGPIPGRPACRIDADQTLIVMRIDY